jgi:hypothetical protein
LGWEFALEETRRLWIGFLVLSFLVFGYSEFELDEIVVVAGVGEAGWMAKKAEVLV